MCELGFRPGIELPVLAQHWFLENFASLVEELKVTIQLAIKHSSTTTNYVLHQRNSHSTILPNACFFVAKVTQ